MHPIERLRFVARATGAVDEDVVREAAGSLASFADDPVSLVTATRRLLDRHPANGPIWWLCGRALLAADPADEVWRCSDALQSDPTPKALADAIEPDAAVAVAGWSDRLGVAFARRGDLEVRVVDVDGDGPGFVRALERLDVDAIDVPVTGMASAAADADLVVLAASAVGPEVALVPAGGWALAAVARAAGVPVWLVAGRGRVIAGGLWPSLVRRLGSAATPPWELGRDLVPLELIDLIVGPGGRAPVDRALASVDVVDVAELRR